MKTWQKGCLVILTILTIGVISFGLYLIFVNETAVSKPESTITPSPPCDKTTVSAWIDRQVVRQNEMNSDLDIIIIIQSPNPDDYIPLANRAKARYNAQRLEQTPECLSGLQSLMIDAYYYNWKGLESISRDDWDEGLAYIEISTNKLEAVEAAIEAAIELTE